MEKATVVWQGAHPDCPSLEEELVQQKDGDFVVLTRMTIPPYRLSVRHLPKDKAREWLAMRR